MRTMLALLLALSPLAAETYLVCAGVETYDDAGISPLKFAVADVTAVADAFRAAGVPPANLTVLTSNASDRSQLPTRANLIRALEQTTERAAEGDTVIFVYSGHGVQRGGDAWLLTIETNPRQLELTAMPMRAVNHALQGLRASRLLFIIDACRNDPDAGRGTADAALSDEFAKGLRPRLVARGAQPPPEAAMLLACDVGQRAWEMAAEGHGAFTWYLLKGLAGEARDTDGAVRLSGLAEYVGREVPAWAQRAQREQSPRFENDAGTDFVLLRPAVVTVTDLPAVLEVTSVPDGAMVTVDGQPEGRTPWRKGYALGGESRRRVAVRLELDNHAAQAAEIELIPGATAGWRNVRLVASERPANWPEYLADFQPPAGLSWASFRVSERDGMPQVLIPAGEFTMGATLAEQQWAAGQVAGVPGRRTQRAPFDEGPQRRVGLSAYWMDLHEVTATQYCQFLNAARVRPDGVERRQWILLAGDEELRIGPGQIQWDRWRYQPLKGADREPVLWVSWAGAVAYALWAGRELPTEAQWERAARAGREGLRYVWGDDARPPDGAGNVADETLRKAVPGGRKPDPAKLFLDPTRFEGYRDGYELLSPVCSFDANGFGLYDMVGNLWEWCRDWYDDGWYGQMPERDPLNETVAERRVLRGGSWANGPGFLRIATRLSAPPTSRTPVAGFRCAAAP